MMLKRFHFTAQLVRRLMLVSLAGAAMAGTPVFCAAQAPAWPTKPVKVIVSFAAGSATDIMARTVADELRTEFGQPFVVENRAGANGILAAEAAARSAPDGYTLFVTPTTTQSNNQFLYKKLPYDPVKDFTPISGLLEAYYVLTVPSTLPVNTVAELVAWIKANPARASYGWGAAVSQVAGVAFLKEVNTTAVGVPYKSSPQAVTDLIGGQLTFIVQGVTAGLSFVKSGQVKALMVSAPQRMTQMPNVPTAREAGVPNFDATSWVGMFAPAGTPEHIVNKINVAVQKILRQPAIVERMDACCSARLTPATPAEFSEFLRKDRINWETRISAAGIRPE